MALRGGAVALSLTDTHCHLDQLGDAAAALAEAAAVGVDRVVAVAQDAASMAAVLDLAARFPGRVLPGLGVHPVEVTRRGADGVAPDLALLEGRLGDAAVIGETGLDHKWAATAAQRAEQAAVLERHLELAARAGRPVNLHSRRCLRQVLERAAAFHRDTGLGAQLHWFTQSRKLVHLSNDAGLYVSAGPAVLHDPQAAQVAGEVADDLLLLESDAPVPVGGSAGHPRRVREVFAKLAAVRGVAVERLAAQLAANLCRFLGAHVD